MEEEIHSSPLLPTPKLDMSSLLLVNILTLTKQDDVLVHQFQIQPLSVRVKTKCKYTSYSPNFNF